MRFGLPKAVAKPLGNKVNIAQKTNFNGPSAEILANARNKYFRPINNTNNNVGISAPKLKSGDLDPIWIVREGKGLESKVLLLPFSRALPAATHLRHTKFSLVRSLTKIPSPLESIWTFSVTGNHITIKMGVPASSTTIGTVPHMKTRIFSVNANLRYFDVPHLGKVILVAEDEIRRPNHFELMAIDKFVKSGEKTVQVAKSESDLSWA